MTRKKKHIDWFSVRREWLLALVSVVLITVAMDLIFWRGGDVARAAEDGVSPPAYEDAVEEVPSFREAWEWKNEERRVPGRILSDLHSALEEGWDSELIQIEDYDGRRLFTDWATRFEEAGQSGLILFREENSDRKRTYRVSFGDEVEGVLDLERVGGRWYVVGAREIR